MKQKSMTDRIVTNINHALEVIPKALHIESEKPARRKSSASQARRTRKPRSTVAKAKRRVNTGLKKAGRLVTKAKRKMAAKKAASSSTRTKRKNTRKSHPSRKSSATITISRAA